MNEMHKRPWWRLHGVTWVAGILILAALVALNLCNLPHLVRPPFMFHEWFHGWPSCFLVRENSIVGDLPDGGSWFKLTGPWLDGEGHAEISLSALLSNFVVGAVLLSCGMLKVEKIRRRCRFRLRLSISGLLSLAASVCCYLVLHRIHAADWQDDIVHVSAIVAYAAIVLSWLALFDLLGIAWNRLTSRRTATEATDPKTISPASR